MLNFIKIKRFKNEKLLRDWTMIIISSFLLVFSIKFFLSKAQILPSGLGAAVQFIILALGSHAPKSPWIDWFGILYLLLNIPIIIIFWKKVKRRLILRTVAWLFLQLIFSYIISITPIVKDGNPFNLKYVTRGGAQILSDEDRWASPFLAIMGGCFAGFSVALSWKAGASTGGVDIIIAYISSRKKKPVGTISLVVSAGITAVSIIVLNIMGKITNAEGERLYFLQGIFGLNILSTVIYIIILMLMLNWIYPKYKKVTLEIISIDPDKLIEQLKKTKHAFTIVKAQGGVDKKEKYIIQTCILLFETKKYVKIIKSVDEEAWCVIKPIKHVIGKFNNEIEEDE